MIATWIWTLSVPYSWWLLPYITLLLGLLINGGKLSRHWLFILWDCIATNFFRIHHVTIKQMSLWMLQKDATAELLGLLVAQIMFFSACCISKIHLCKVSTVGVCHDLPTAGQESRWTLPVRDVIIPLFARVWRVFHQSRINEFDMRDSTLSIPLRESSASGRLCFAWLEEWSENTGHDDDVGEMLGVFMLLGSPNR